jgi:dephospho-CoA kinase
MKRTDKPVIGLAGGIGSGKSTVAAIMEELGAAVIVLDDISHEELDDPEVLATIQAWWGNQVLKPNGNADRQAIRAIVAEDGEQRKRLERLLHPRIAHRSEELLTRYREDPSVKAIVWDAPLLFEVGLDKRCDYVVFVDAPEAERIQRVADQRGWSAEDLRQMEKSQKPLDLKKKMSDYVVTNSDIDELRREVEDVFSKILTGG